MNKKHKIAIGCLFIAVVLGYISKEVLGAFNCGFPPSEGKEGGMVASLINRSQLGYWFQYGKFATIDELVAEGFKFQQKNYKYSMEVADNAVFAHSYTTIANGDICSREEAPLLSLIFMRENTPTYTFVSGFFITPENKPKNILCVSKTPGWQKLNKPYLEGDELVCGEGTSLSR